MAKDKILKATHDGVLKIGNVILPCAVLEDGTRVLTQQGFFRAIGRKGKSKGQTIIDGSYQLPTFLRAKNLKPFIEQELAAPTAPIVFQPLHGGRTAFGYKAELLTDVCKAFLAAQDAGVLTAAQIHIAIQCGILMRGFAHVGIIALIDEATGYQDFRIKRALAKILEKYIADELRKWTKTFPDEFYKELFKLKGWKFHVPLKKKPWPVGNLTDDLVYKRLAPGVRDKLREVNIKDKKGRRKAMHHQWLTPDLGHPKLKEHLAAVIALMKASSNWRNFYRLLNRALPVWGKTLELPLEFPEES
jgi:hypothetical protein